MIDHIILLLWPKWKFKCYGCTLHGIIFSQAFTYLIPIYPQQFYNIKFYITPPSAPLGPPSPSPSPPPWSYLWASQPPLLRLTPRPWYTIPHPDYHNIPPTCCYGYVIAGILVQSYWRPWGNCPSPLNEVRCLELSIWNTTLTFGGCHPCPKNKIVNCNIKISILIF